MSKPGLTLLALPGRYTVHRFPADAPLPALPTHTPFLTLTRSATELSVLCEASISLDSMQQETDFVCFQIEGTLDFSLVGILADLTGCLAEAELSTLAISSFDTDYLLVRAADADAARRAWQAAGHVVRDDADSAEIA